MMLSTIFRLVLSLTLVLASLVLAIASDSLRIEKMNGKTVIVHKVDQGQTLYALARRYQVNVNDIKALNPGLTQLQVGAEVFIPFKSGVGSAEISNNSAVSSATKPTNEKTHIVQPGETVYRIARNYGLTAQEISEYNQLGSTGIKVGQSLKIPSKGVASKSNDSGPLPSSNEPVKPKSEKRTSASGYPSITESGEAQLEPSLNTELFFSVGHKSAPIGTLLFLKNKANGNTVHARVVNHPSNTTTSTILWVSQSVLDKLESKDTRFVVEIYYTPEQ